MARTHLPIKLGADSIKQPKDVPTGFVKKCHIMPFLIHIAMPQVLNIALVFQVTDMLYSTTHPSFIVRQRLMKLYVIMFIDKKCAADVAILAIL